MERKSFITTLKKVMEHNEYTPEMLTVEECDKQDRWTPCDLILREYLNNGGGSAKGFLGIGPKACESAYRYICEHKQELIEQNYINKDAHNNFGFSLWKNWNFDR